MKYFMLKKELYGNLLQFINEENDANDDYFDILVEQIKNQKITKSKEELKHFLRLIESISSNYHRYIENMIFQDKSKFKQYLSLNPAPLQGKL